MNLYYECRKRDEERKNISNQVEEFLKKGKKIKVLKPIGVETNYNPIFKLKSN